MYKTLVFGAATAALLITGCADTNMSDTQRRTATGAGVGALAGAVLSSATGGKAGTGAVVGAAVGGLTSPDQVKLGDPVWDDKDGDN